MAVSSHSNIFKSLLLRRSLSGSSANFVVQPVESKGFTIFEMVVFIIMAAIIYSVAVNRFTDYPEAAERANFQAVLTQIQSGVNLEVMTGISTGIISNVRDYEEMNPMDLLLRPPSNYRGVIHPSGVNALPRRSWYFDSVTGELVYLINASQNVFLIAGNRQIPTTELRFKIVALYRDSNSLQNVTYQDLVDRSESQVDGETSTQLALRRELSNVRVSGAVLRPVVPFVWEAQGVFDDLIDESA